MSIDFTTATKLPGNFSPQPDQSRVDVYKRTDLLYHVIVDVDEETYFLRNGDDFYSTEPILPKEHLRMQQLMEREHRTRCKFCITFKDINSDPKVITVDRDELLHAFLLNHKSRAGGFAAGNAPAGAKHKW